ncbi:PP151 [Orf virus]|uniref:PP151 n=1 Tax=Orf virus TaxID=10258 RepID=F1AWW8_ORFV|nr:PP151 [Orf virus]
MMSMSPPKSVSHPASVSMGSASEFSSSSAGAEGAHSTNQRGGFPSSQQTSSESSMRYSWRFVSCLDMPSSFAICLAGSLSPDFRRSSRIRDAHSQAIVAYLRGVRFFRILACLSFRRTWED